MPVRRLYTFRIQAICPPGFYSTRMFAHAPNICSPVKLLSGLLDNFALFNSTCDNVEYYKLWFECLFLWLDKQN